MLFVLSIVGTAELKSLRGVAAVDETDVAIQPGEPLPLGLEAGVARQSEAVVTFALPAAAATFGVAVGPTACVVDYAPPANASAAFYEVAVDCGGAAATLRLLARETSVEVGVLPCFVPARTAVGMG